MDFISIINSLGVLGTLVLGFINLFLLKKRERQSQEYNLKMIDYEKRRDFLLTNISEYISLLDAHKLSYMASSDEEYKGKSRDTYMYYLKLEACFYKIKLYLNSDNVHFNELISILDKSIDTAKEIQYNNSVAEMVSNGLRHPKEYVNAYYKNLNISKKLESDDLDIGVDNEKTTDFLKEAKKIKNEHLKKCILSVEGLSEYKKEIVYISRKYLKSEKELVIGVK